MSQIDAETPVSPALARQVARMNTRKAMMERLHMLGLAGRELGAADLATVVLMTHLETWSLPRPVAAQLARAVTFEDWGAMVAGGARCWLWAEWREGAWRPALAATAEMDGLIRMRGAAGLVAVNCKPLLGETFAALARAQHSAERPRELA